MNKIICKLCKDTMEVDHPGNVYLRNPETFRKAWMHKHCYLSSLNDLRGIPSNNVIYKNKYDEYITRFGGDG